MKYSGKTPLLRARNIEKKLGIKRLYIKLEGANPTESKHDRLAWRIVFSAMSQEKTNIVAEGSKAYLRALAYYTDIYHLSMSVVQFKNQNWKNSLGIHVSTIDHSGKSKPKTPKFYQKLSITDSDYLAIEGLNHDELTSIAYSTIAEEIIEKMKKPANTVFYTHREDYQNSLYNTYLQDYMKTRNQMPKLLSVKSIKKIDHAEDDIVVDEELIAEAYSMLTKLEHLKMKKNDAIPFAGFLDKFNRGEIEEGHHVIVLDRAKTRVDIRRLENFDEISKEQLLGYVDHYLDKYSDPLEDAKDALENAIEKGFILVATRGEIVDGVCVIVNMGFDKFIPTYHLAYIGTNPHSKGRGLGTELIEFAVDLADSKISLHVDLDNYRAKKLYEKMGFKHVYNRMIFQNEE
ncbi:MAG: pyridoxal-phosphate dependent enzyme [Tenericutes bacterium]|jgi:threonine synthase|nr:pyridoxal-phosphate dependent enzyme [Mycoplasmatota bacterium]